MTDPLNYFNDFVAQGKTLLEPVIEFNEITTRTVTALAEQQFGLLSETFEVGTGSLQAASRAEGVSDFAEDQSRLATELGQRIKAHADTALETIAKSQKAYGDWFAGVFKAQSEVVANATNAAE